MPKELSSQLVMNPPLQSSDLAWPMAHQSLAQLETIRRLPMVGLSSALLCLKLIPMVPLSQAFLNSVLASQSAHHQYLQSRKSNVALQKLADSPYARSLALPQPRDLCPS